MGPVWISLLVIPFFIIFKLCFLQSLLCLSLQPLFIIFVLDGLIQALDSAQCITFFECTESIAMIGVKMSIK
jgi:hypothetical protein